MVARLACTPPETAVCILLDSRARILFLTRFSEGSFGGLLELKMGHAAYRRKALDVLFPTIPDQTGDAFGEPRVPRRSLESLSFQRTRARTDQLVASRKDSAREGGSCAAYFCKVPDSREIRAWTCEIWFREQRPPGVFLVRLRAVFRSGFRLDPDKILAIREFHVVHGCVFFPMCPGSQINLLRVRKTLCASVATSVGKFRKFQHSLISSACFHARGRRSSRCRISTILVSSESLVLPTFPTVQALHRGELGFARYDPANGGRRNVPYAKGGGQFDPVFGLVNGPVKPWSNLVNLGQTWSNLVKSSPNSWEMYPGPRFEGFWARWDPSRVETARSNLGQTLVNSGQTWSTLVKLGQTLGNVSRTFFWGVFDVMSPRRIRPAWFGLPSFCVPTPEKIPGVKMGL
uniref:Uncharacterized protein n=1 Tax=Fagus sylvatica TaxID=28930 RepID=A0A2N9HAJ4_FAGSY